MNALQLAELFYTLVHWLILTITFYNHDYGNLCAGGLKARAFVRFIVNTNSLGKISFLLSRSIYPRRSIITRNYSNKIKFVSFSSDELSRDYAQWRDISADFQNGGNDHF